MATALDPARAAYYDKIGTKGLAPLWEVLRKITPREPQSPAIAHRWRYGEVRDMLLEGGALLTAAEAERRVLVLENPGMRGESCITRSLYAGLQLILPGEVAPSHRHAQNALRLVVEGEGAYTAVDGERIPMSRGDLILTPAHVWHDHGHEGTAPVVWMDVLDVPQVLHYDASYVEHGPWNQHPRTRRTSDNRARYGAGMRPLSEPLPGDGPTKLMHYPYAEWSAAARAAAESDLDPHFGAAFEFVDPHTGGPIMTTIAAFAHYLPEGFTTLPVRRTDATVFHVLEGSGQITVGDTSYDVIPHDIVVVPSWHSFTLCADAELVLFAVSDRAPQRALGLWREERLGAN